MKNSIAHILELENDSHDITKNEKWKAISKKRNNPER